jgi:folate-dependent phosphoribosylglycinamide formyltransferase PurN
MRKLRVGAICSSGGSALAEVFSACPHVSFFVLTDRECGAEKKCRDHHVPFERIEEKNNERFSVKAAEMFSAAGRLDFIILFFSRLVTNPLLERFTVLNVHPALLPSFKGFNAVRQAHEATVRFFGASLHIATPGADEGPIIAQACQPLRVGDVLPYLQKSSFIHKVCLGLIAVELFETDKLRIINGVPVLANGVPASQCLNPGLVNPVYLDFVKRLQAAEEVQFI